MPADRLGFNHAPIRTRDLGRALGLYRGPLGFDTIDARPPYHARLRSRKGTRTIALHAAREDRRLDPAGEGVRLCYEVRDLDAVCERLAARGVRFEQRPKDVERGWRHAYLKDPDGHELSLYRAGERRLKKTQRASGSFLWTGQGLPARQKRHFSGFTWTGRGLIIRPYLRRGMRLLRLRSPRPGASPPGPA